MWYLRSKKKKLIENTLTNIEDTGDGQRREESGARRKG